MSLWGLDISPSASHQGTRPVCARPRASQVCVPVRSRPCATRSLEMAHRLSLIRTVQRHDTGAAVSPGAAGGSGESAAKGNARPCARLGHAYGTVLFAVVRGRSSCNEPPRSSSRQRSPVHCIRHFARPRMCETIGCESSSFACWCVVNSPPMSAGALPPEFIYGSRRSSLILAVSQLSACMCL